MISSEHLPMNVSLDRLVSPQRRSQLAAQSTHQQRWAIEQAMLEVLHAYISGRRVVRDGVTVPRKTKETRYVS